MRKPVHPAAPLVTLALAVLLLSPRPVQAECAAPRPFFAVGEGEVPARPIIHFFEPLPRWGGAVPAPPVFWARLPDGLQGRIQVGGQEVPVRVESLPAPLAWRAFRVQLLIDGPGAVLLGAASRGASPSWPAAQVSLRVNPELPRHQAPALVLTGVQEKRFLWPCSFTLGPELSFTTEATVLRLEWAETRADFESGQREVLYLPAREGAFFGGGPPSAERAAGVVLGHQSCLGPTFDWPGESVWATVQALGPGGALGPLAPEGREPLLLTRPEDLEEQQRRWYPER